MKKLERMKIRRGYNFNRITTMAAINALKGKVIKENNVILDYYKPKHKSFLIICNHTDAADPGYLMAALNQYIRFIASDHIVRLGLGKVFKYVGGVIVKEREKPSSILVGKVIKNLQAGIPVGLFAEGAISINGQTGFISENTGKLVKDSGVALITYKFVGGYLRSPRWANSSRKGPIIGHAVGEYSAEELAKMSVEEITELIRRDTYVNVYEEQKTNPREYSGENLAECVERVLFVCPKCKQVGTMHSKGDELRCDCGAVVTMKNDGLFYGEDVVYNNVLDWDMWQRRFWKEKVLSAQDGEVIFSEDGQIVKKVALELEESLSDNATITLYKDKFVVTMEDKTITMKMDEIKQTSLARKDSILVVDGNVFLDISSHVPRSSTKYVAAWRYLTGREYY